MRSTLATGGGSGGSDGGGGDGKGPTTIVLTKTNPESFEGFLELLYCKQTTVSAARVDEVRAAAPKALLALLLVDSVERRVGSR